MKLFWWVFYLLRKIREGYETTIRGKRYQIRRQKRRISKTSFPQEAFVDLAGPVYRFLLLQLLEIFCNHDF